MAAADRSVTYTRSVAPLSAAVDGEIVMLEPSTSRYFGLADTAARIWELLDEPRSAEQVVDALLLEYDIDRDTCTTEVLAFLAQLEDAGLVEKASADG